MRTLSEIQEELQTEWMRSSVIQKLYGFAPDTLFSSVYSKASIESFLVYIVSYCAYALEFIFSKIQSELEEKISLQVPGRIEWYARTVKNYLYNFSLDDYGDFVIPDDATDADVQKAAIVKHAVAIDDQRTTRVIIKVAGEDSSGNRCPLSKDQETALQQYILRIKYAGVKTLLINAPGDVFNCKIDIWFDPLRVKNEVFTDCKKAIKDYIENLPFNGVFSLMALTDVLQNVSDVRLVQILSCSRIGADGTKTITNYSVPYAGYFTEGDVVLNMKEFTI